MRTPRAVGPLPLLAAASLWMAFAGNAALWRELHALGLLQAAGGWLLALALGGMVAALLFSALCLLAWPRVLKPLLVLLLLVTAAGAYFMWTYHVVIDGSMAQNILQTDWHEARALASGWLALVLVLGAGVPALLLARIPLAPVPWHSRALRNAAGAAVGLAVCAVLLLASFQPLASAMRGHKHLRYLLNPLNSVYALTRAAWPAAPGGVALRPVGRDAQAASPVRTPPLLVLVVGETGRSGNFGLNGYARPTTPELERAGAASFTNAWSCATHTAASLPCMFSQAGRVAFLERGADAENLLDVLQHAGLAVLWIDNQPGGCKGVCDRVPHVNTSGTADPVLCPGGECSDGILVKDLDARLAALPAGRRARGVVLVLHMMGSHGPAYASRSPPAFKRFLPECATSHLPDCSAETLRNAYDNSIAYTDHVLGDVIRWLQSRPDHEGALVYVADHGESLGENNLYLHGLPYAIAPDVQKHIPWVTWLSPAYEQRTGLAMGCLRSAAAVPVTHDNLFHSVLGLLQVSTVAYRRERDAYAGCAAH